MSWFEFNGGSTIREHGTEGGDIIKDEEFISSARITLEKLSGGHYAMTCGVYGVFFHTAWFSSSEAFSKYEEIKAELEAILCCENDGDYYKLIDELVDRH